MTTSAGAQDIFSTQEEGSDLGTNKKGTFLFTHWKIGMSPLVFVDFWAIFAQTVVQSEANEAVIGVVKFGNHLGLPASGQRRVLLQKQADLSRVVDRDVK